MKNGSKNRASLYALGKALKQAGRYANCVQLCTKSVQSEDVVNKTLKHISVLQPDDFTICFLKPH
jgi:ribonuclease HI